jgi:hypothetical protein
VVIYLDSAAIVKLVHRESESDALDMWLAERLGEPRVTSALAEVFVTYDKRPLSAASTAGLPTASPGM